MLIALIIGVGSVGKKHALKLSKIANKIYVVDPDEETLKWCQKNIETQLSYFSNINDVFFENSDEAKSCVGVISNWGTDHYDTFLKLTERNIKKIYMEKPFANSLKKIDQISKFVSENQIDIVSGFQLRHSKLNDKLKKISDNYLGGDPSLITVDGGANCIVTNGIHFVDLACSIFQSYPDHVFSKLNKDLINPRSKGLGFWEGFSSFSFNERRLDISFSNRSSIRLTCKVFYKHGYITILDKGNFVEVNVYKRDNNEVKNDPRITRTGQGQLIKDFDFSSHSTSNTFKDLVNSLFDKNVNFDIDRETIATKCILSSLISSKEEKLIKLPLDYNNIYYDTDWPIS